MAAAEPEKPKVPEEPVAKQPEALEDMFPDVDVLHLSAIVKLLDNLGMNVEDIESVDATPYVRIYVAGQEWVVMNDTEADEYATQSAEDSLEELGTEGLNITWKDYVTNEDDFETACIEQLDNYINDIAEEQSKEPDMFPSRLEEEMHYADVADRDSFLQYLIEKAVPNDDYVQWYIDEFGDEAFMGLAALDTEGIAKYIVDTDGRGSVISSYDGEEVELSTGYSAFRVN